MNKDFFIKNKKKIIIGVIVLAISLIGISLINSTYFIMKIQHQILMLIVLDYYLLLQVVRERILA